MLYTGSPLFSPKQHFSKSGLDVAAESENVVTLYTGVGGEYGSSPAQSARSNDLENYCSGNLSPTLSTPQKKICIDRCSSQLPNCANHSLCDGGIRTPLQLLGTSNYKRLEKSFDNTDVCVSLDFSDQSKEREPPTNGLAPIFVRVKPTGSRVLSRKMFAGLDVLEVRGILEKKRKKKHTAEVFCKWWDYLEGIDLAWAIANRHIFAIVFKQAYDEYRRDLYACFGSVLNLGQYMSDNEMGVEMSFCTRKCLEAVINSTLGDNMDPNNKSVKFLIEVMICEGLLEGGTNMNEFGPYEARKVVAENMTFFDCMFAGCEGDENDVNGTVWETMKTQLEDLGKEKCGLEGNNRLLLAKGISIMNKAWLAMNWHIISGGGQFKLLEASSRTHGFSHQGHPAYAPLENNVIGIYRVPHSNVQEYMLKIRKQNPHNRIQLYERNLACFLQPLDGLPIPGQESKIKTATQDQMKYFHKRAELFGLSQDRIDRIFEDDKKKRAEKKRAKKSGTLVASFFGSSASSPPEANAVAVEKIWSEVSNVLNRIVSNVVKAEKAEREVRTEVNKVLKGVVSTVAKEDKMKQKEEKKDVSHPWKLYHKRNTKKRQANDQNLQQQLQQQQLESGELEEAAKKKRLLLLAGWTSHIDRTSGKTYYYNKELKKSTWKSPLESDMDKKWTCSLCSKEFTSRQGLVNHLEKKVCQRAETQQLLSKSEQVAFQAAVEEEKKRKLAANTKPNAAVEEEKRQRETQRFTAEQPEPKALMDANDLDEPLVNSINVWLSKGKGVTRQHGLEMAKILLKGQKKTKMTEKDLDATWWRSFLSRCGHKLVAG